MRSYKFVSELQEDAGFRVGDKGTHTSRTIMVTDIARVLQSGLSGEALKRVELEENLLEKATTSGRSLTLQRLRELYSLETATPLFRVLSTLWEREAKSLPLLALLAALARDPCRQRKRVRTVDVEDDTPGDGHAL